MGNTPDQSPRPVLLFDGECGFCTLTAEWLRRHVRHPVHIIPWQRANLALYRLDPAQARSAAWWIAEDGRRYRGHRAIGKALLACRGGWPPLGRLVLAPPFSWISAPVYHLISKYRGHLPATVPACRRADWPSDH